MKTTVGILMSGFRFYTLLIAIWFAAGCSCPPLYTEHCTISRGIGGWKNVQPDETSPTYTRLIGALMNEGFVIVSITNAIPQNRATRPSFETNHKVVVFKKSSVSGVFEYYRNSEMDYFFLDAKAGNKADAARCNYYRFKSKLQQLIAHE